MKNSIYGLLLLGLLSVQAQALENVCNQPIDLVLAFDASGSVYSNSGDNHALWKQQIDFAKALVSSHVIAPDSTHVSVVASSGCSNAVTTFEGCVSEGRLVQHLALSSDESSVHNLLDYGSNNTPEGIDNDDLLLGTSWTDARLQLANNQFESSTRAASRKVIVLFTDSDPYPASYAMCTSEGVVSNTLQTVRNNQTDLFVVNVFDAINDACAVTQEDDYFDLSSLDNTHYLDRILENRDGDLLCGDSDLDSDNDGVNNVDDS